MPMEKKHGKKQPFEDVMYLLVKIKMFHWYVIYVIFGVVHPKKFPNLQPTSDRSLASPNGPGRRPALPPVKISSFRAQEADFWGNWLHQDWWVGSLMSLMSLR